MLDKARLYNELKDVLNPAAADKLAEILFMVYEELRYRDPKEKKDSQVTEESDRTIEPD